MSDPASPTTHATRVLLTAAPFSDPTTSIFQRGQWPAHWVCQPGLAVEQPVVLAYRRAFSLAATTRLRLHVSADERYELFLDGARIGRGPERGDRDNWFFESYDLELPAGDHVLVARTWWLGTEGWSPFAQLTVRPAFLLAAEGVPAELLNTGIAPWESRQLGGYEFASTEMCWGTVARFRIHGAEFNWGFERGSGDGWGPVKQLRRGTNAEGTANSPALWFLRPATLPAMHEAAITAGVVREGDDAPAWNNLFQGRSAVTVPAHTTRRVLVDLENYYCVYPEVVLSGGAGARVQLFWAEALFEDPTKGVKGNRDAVAGKQFVGVGDVFETDGGRGRLFEPLWWIPGRYLEITVTTQAEPLTIESIRLRETHYPCNWESRFESSDARLAEFWPIAQRVMEMCSHETYMDCPYYEQLQYVGDTRLEALTTYALTRDDRLPRKALRMFDVSRSPAGLTRSQYPSRWMQLIPPFSLWWVGMVYDYARWRDDAGFVRDRLPGVRAVLDAFRHAINSDHLLTAMDGWNFGDWVPGWEVGIPPDGDHGISGVLNWQLVYTLRLATALEEFAGEPELAIRNRQLADQVATAVSAAFWDERRGAFADDLSKRHFSEHSQCLAILAGQVSGDRAVQLLEGADLARTTIYFTHYLFETYSQLGLAGRLFERLGLWFGLKGQGFRTTPEAPEPSRSDCHAWGAHPLYHYYASILGIRPGTWGFRSVRIAPQLGPLRHVSARMAHPKGVIEVEFRVKNETLTGRVSLPPGVGGSFTHQNREIALQPGQNELG